MASAPRWLQVLIRTLAMRDWGLIAAAMMLLAGLLGWQNGLGRLDQTLYDKFVSMDGRPAREDIIIVGIDDFSLRELGRWPWSRSVHAQLIDNLTQYHPRAIGLDLILSEPEDRQENDQALVDALMRNQRTVLPVLSAHGGAGLAASPPITPLRMAAAALGHINLEHDSDGVVRKAFLREGQGGQWWPQFALALSSVATATPAASEVVTRGPWQREQAIFIPFSGNSGHIQSVPYVAVLRGEVPPQFFTGKYVLVGATALGMSDAYPTPVSAAAGVMPGVEIHAQILSALLDGKSISTTAAWQTALLSALPVLIAMIGYILLPPRQGLLLAALLLVVVLLGSFSALTAGFWIAPSAAVIALLLSYPLWSWRRLEAAITYLDQEFSRLDQEPHLLPEITMGQKTDRFGEALERRINAMTHAVRRVRDLRQFVSDSLDSLPDASMVTTTEGRILLWNRQAKKYFAALGQPLIDGQTVQTLLACLNTPQPLDAPGNHAFHWARLLKEQYSASLTNGVGVSDAQGRDVLVKSAPCHSATGTLNGWIISLIDISAIRAVERNRDESLRFLSHDMRAPQATILALIELQQEPESALPLTDLLARIATASRRTLGLADNFVQLARAESHAYRSEEVDFKDIVFDAIDELWALAKNKRIALISSIAEAEADYPVYVDRDLVTRALTNLLSNAINYSPEDTRVICTLTLQPSATPPQVVCSVCDHGYGIAMADQSKLFQRFQRIGHPQQPWHEGTGLGLVFVKTVIERHAGRIDFSSTVDEGSCFTLMLPLYQTDQAGPA